MTSSPSHCAALFPVAGSTVGPHLFGPGPAGALDGTYPDQIGYPCRALEAVKKEQLILFWFVGVFLGISSLLAVGLQIYQQK